MLHRFHVLLPLCVFDLPTSTVEENIKLNMSNPVSPSQSQNSKPDNSQDIHLEGYVHQLSPIKISRKTAKPFFDCLVQTSNDKAVRTVCYEPKQRKKLVDPFLKKSPIKITGVKRMAPTSFSTSEEFKITPKSKFAPSSTQFVYNSQVSSSVLTINEALASSEYKVIDVMAKVLTKDQQHQTITKQSQQLKKSDCVIGDKTGSIKLTLWEELISTVECGNTYWFRSVKVRVFDDSKYLSTNPSTAIEPAQEEISDVDLTTEDFADNIVEGLITSVKMTSTKVCLVCNKAVTEEDDEDGLTTCPSSTCDSTMLTSRCPTKLISYLTVEMDNGQQHRYTCFNNAMHSFLQSINSTAAVADLSEKDFKKLFLNAGTRKMIIDNSTKIIHQFLL